MDTQTIGSNLRRLRLSREQTQEELAAAAGLSRAGYRKIEQGASVPRSDTLLSLARALEVGVEELVRPVPRLHRVRFRSKKQMKRRDQVLAQIAHWLEAFEELETLLDEHCTYQLAQRARPEEPAQAAEKIRGELGLGEGESIRDICGLLERACIKIYPIRLATDQFFGLSVAANGGGPAIVVNTWERISVERWIFSAAHELGHLVLHLGAYDVDRKDEEDQQEKEADRFASYFLMPADVFDREWQETYGLPFVDRVLKVKRIFRVSYATVLYRLTEVGLGANVWGRFRAQYRRRTGRQLFKADEPDPLLPSAFREGAPEPAAGKEPDRLSRNDFREDRLSRLVRRAIEEEKITLSRGAEILDLSLDDMRELANDWVPA